MASQKAPRGDVQLQLFTVGRDCGCRHNPGQPEKLQSTLEHKSYGERILPNIPRNFLLIRERVTKKIDSSTE